MRRFIGLGCVLVVCACGESGSSESSNLAPLTRIDPEGPGTNCVAGGSAVRTGLDRNRDGVLQDDEITSTAYVCAEAQRTLLIRTSPADASACPSGGTLVLEGVDANGDGALQDAEVERTTTVCDDSEPPVLTRTAAIAPGATCPAGGSAVEVGRDRNGDGVLQDDEVQGRQTVCGAAVLVVGDRVRAAPGCPGSATRIRSGADANGDGALSDAEVQSTSYVCSEVTYGYEVRTQADLDYLNAKVSLVYGDVIVHSDTLTKVDLYGMAVTGAIHVIDSPALKTLSVTPLLLGGDVEIARNPALAAVYVGVGRTPLVGSLSVTDCPSVETLWLSHTPSIQGSLRLVRAGIRYASAEDLTAIGGDLVLENTQFLQAVDLPALRTIGGDFLLRGNVDLGKEHDWDDGLHGHTCIQAVGGEVGIADNVALGWLRLPCLTRARSVRVMRNAALSSIDFGALGQVDGDVDVQDNPKLASTGSASPTARTGLVIGGGLTVTDNPMLYHLTGLGSSLIEAGDVTVARNPSLAWLHLAHLSRADQVTIVDNDSLAFIGRSGFPGAIADEFDALTRLYGVYGLSVRRNASLARLQLPALEYAQSLDIVDNPILPTCQAQAVVAGLTGTPRSVTLTGNDDAATCP